MNPVIYSGDGTNGQNITGVNFSPDLVWVKSRTAAQEHMLYDSVRGADKLLRSNNTAGDATTSTTTYFTSFDSDGFTVGSETALGASGANFVSWNWLAGSSPSSNTDGTITSSVSANTDSGFSIVSYTATGSASTIGHGLGVVPKMIISKSRTNGSANWLIYHSNLTSASYILTFTTSAEGSIPGVWNGTAPTTSVFSVGTDGAISGDMIAYCFAEKKGFSKFGSYTGNGSTDGTFVYTGFKPSFILVKNIQTTVNSWEIHDNKRDPFNVGTKRLYPNVNNSEGSGTYVDMLSNGFKWRSSDGGHNSANTFIYAAFAENPLVANTSGGIPTTAR